MTIHDRYARVTPYEIAIPGRAFADERFGAVRDEADERGMNAWEPGTFVMLAQAGRAVRDIRGEDDDPALIHQYGIILYHAYHFWSAGEPLYLVETHTARQLVDGERAGELDGRSPAVPSPAAYVQLPHLLFWAKPDPEGPAESLDGFFWVLTPAKELHLLVALGMRTGRPGLSVISVPGVELEEARSLAADRARPDGTDFQSTLPGGQLDELYSIETHAEALKLTALFLRHIAHFPEVVGESVTAQGSAGTGRGPVADGEPLHSTLAYRCVRPAEAG